MRRVTKYAVLMLFSLLCLLGISGAVFAEPIDLAKVTGVTIVSNETSATIKWRNVASADGYYVCTLNSENGTMKEIAQTKTTQAVIKNLTSGKQYRFVVNAYINIGGEFFVGPASDTVMITPKIKKPATPSLSVTSCGNKKITLKWPAIKNATGYEVFQKNSAGDYVSLGTVKKTSVVVNKLTNGTAYYFKVRAFRTISGSTRYGKLSPSVSAKPFKVTKTVKSIHTMYYSARVISTVNARTTDGTKTYTVQAGTMVTAMTRKNGVAKSKLPNGEIVNLSTGNLQWVSCITNSKKDYSTSVKEHFVNYKGYKSSSKYLVWINLPKQHMYIFKGSQCNWKHYKTYKCASGMAATPTPPAIYQLRRKSYLFRFDEDCFGYYASFFSGNAIHSWVYTNAGNRYNDGQVGAPASHGCVRIEKPQAKWFYDTIPVGTTIVIY